jgi:hypothetical protein
MGEEGVSYNSNGGSSQTYDSGSSYAAPPPRRPSRKGAWVGEDGMVYHSSGTTVDEILDLMPWFPVIKQLYRNHPELLLNHDLYEARLGPTAGEIANERLNEENHPSGPERGQKWLEYCEEILYSPGGLIGQYYAEVREGISRQESQARFQNRLAWALIIGFVVGAVIFLSLL